MKAVSPGLEAAKWWVLRWGSDAEVLEPFELRLEVQAELEAMLAVYTEELDTVLD